MSLRLFVIGIFIGLSTYCGASYGTMLKASVPELPPADSKNPKHSFQELIVLMDAAYVEGDITAMNFPFERSVANVEKGLADFHLPLIHNPDAQPTSANYRPIQEPMGKVTFVIYSHADKPITKAMLDEGLNQPSFPYRLETNPGHSGLFSYPMERQAHLENMILKVQSQRIDAFIYSQEKSDRTICSMQAAEVHRAHFGNFFDIPVVQKSAHGDEVDKIVSMILKRLKASGEMQDFWSKIHRPFTDWQPHQQDWRSEPDECRKMHPPPPPANG
ncbi:hypothetical protein K0504_17850 [Neiella marina]|uniref:Uncharacterized protein n=1 Tax=Neiella holothuriorum TaxID=2870530 RepID=A0ABS7EKM3_9GAMM|nr:hypothetical protein [Neiella holothuriorum]MBW8192903.1 hypothetical protein [Neiella holothuriorum]